MLKCGFYAGQNRFRIMCSGAGICTDLNWFRIMRSGARVCTELNCFRIRRSGAGICTELNWFRISCWGAGICIELNWFRISCSEREFHDHKLRGNIRKGNFLIFQFVLRSQGPPHRPTGAKAVWFLTVCGQVSVPNKKAFSFLSPPCPGRLWTRRLHWVPQILSPIM
jgi:hypothetical protein